MFGAGVTGQTQVLKELVSDAHPLESRLALRPRSVTSFTGIELSKACRTGTFFPAGWLEVGSGQRPEHQAARLVEQGAADRTMPLKLTNLLGISTLVVHRETNRKWFGVVPTCLI